MKKQIILPLLALSCLAACSSDEEEVTPANDTPLPMTVEVSENPMADENGARKQAPTRGTEITTSSLSSFSMNYQENKYDFTKTAGTWNTNTWPSVENDTKIDFYAYNGGTFNYNDGSPYLTYTVEGSDPGNQKDLLVATHKNIAYNDAGGKVTLAFDHVCVALDFQVKITNTLQTSLGADNSLTIKSIELQGIKNTGNYNYTDGNWTAVSGSANYTLTNSAIDVTTEAQPLSCGTLFLIPQEAVFGTTQIVINFSDDKKNTIALTNNLDMANGVNWNTSRKKTVTIKIGTNLYNGRT